MHVFKILSFCTAEARCCLSIVIRVRRIQIMLMLLGNSRSWIPLASSRWGRSFRTTCSQLRLTALICSLLLQITSFNLAPAVGCRHNLSNQVSPISSVFLQIDPARIQLVVPSCRHRVWLQRSLDCYSCWSLLLQMFIRSWIRHHGLVVPTRRTSFMWWNTIKWLIWW